MFNAINTALNGMNTAAARYNSDANNINTDESDNVSEASNVSTDTYTPDNPDDDSDDGDQNLATDVTNLHSDQFLYDANAAVIHTSSQMLGSLLNITDTENPYPQNTDQNNNCS
ncbi:MAG TPA: hypothetical protein VFE58_12435 [Tepidisphaeraceae bacterium]|jgi:flagellar hook protein FlgE|nr:hypothetical protein [Tepidisphaeraceae bacterium]